MRAEAPLPCGGSWDTFVCISQLLPSMEVCASLSKSGNDKAKHFGVLDNPRCHILIFCSNRTYLFCKGHGSSLFESSFVGYSRY